jgi:dipeptidyl aminopeptidase/acylaminoacyl peptidase
MTALGDVLAGVAVPDAENARRRSAAVLDAAFAARPPRPARRRVAPPLAVLAAVLTATAAALAASGQGGELGRWVSELVDPGPARTLARLPAAGRLLVVEHGEAALVSADGSRVTLGRFADATWSPHGMFIAGASGTRLVAVDPEGAERWSVTAPATVRDPRWGPDGFRVAYRAGASLRVVAGDGSGDRLVAGRAAPLAPAWRPDASHVLAYAGPRGVVVAQADGGRRRLAAALPRQPRWLGWAGGQLLAARPHALVAAHRTWTAPRGAVVVTAAVAPDLRSIAVLLRRGTLSRIVVLGAARLRVRRSVATVAGALRDVTWSPDGRWLAVSGDAPRWLLVPLAAGAHPHAIRGTAHPRAWCCGP